ncbi:MAG TPA: hypothetical protein VG365_11465 [Solirubrobacteraceae bacterium]|nr:hypothetical protein [Solirubrobacteraceae bacterium]
MGKRKDFVEAPLGSGDQSARAPHVEDHPLCALPEEAVGARGAGWGGARAGLCGGDARRDHRTGGERGADRQRRALATPSGPAPQLSESAPLARPVERPVPQIG